MQFCHLVTCIAVLLILSDSQTILRAVCFRGLVLCQTPCGTSQIVSNTSKHVYLQYTDWWFYVLLRIEEKAVFDFTVVQKTGNVQHRL